MALCHRCEETVPEGAGFCPNCGAAQLYLSVDDDAQPEQPDGTPAPPPRAGPVEWPVALRGVAIVGITGFLIFFGSNWTGLLQVLSLVFVLSAGQLAVDLYRRKRSLARLDGIVGARIGAAAGVLVAAANAMAIALAGWLERFPLHHGAQLDAEYDAGIKLMQPMMEKMMGTAQAAEQIHLALIPEIRAGRQVSGVVFVGMVIFAVVTVGGVISGLLNGRRRRIAQ